MGQYLSIPLIILGLYYWVNSKKVLQTKDLHIKYSEKSISFPNVDLKSADQLLITGRSGSGKTSFLNALGGLQTPSKGSVKIDNVDSMHYLKEI